ncbi:MAG: hypothetical protein K1X35_07700 [Caulobacteraceae bacterium]|nr:hypothetical protein [Caulobacteraceae bacterium]
MNAAWLIIAFAGALAVEPAGVAPTPPPPELDSRPLDCSQGYAGLKATIRALPGAAAVAAPAGVQLEAVSTQAGGILTIYNFTTPSNPAHPYVARRRIFPEDGVMNSDISVCPYGDKAASDALTAEFNRLNDAFVLSLSRPPR